MRVIAAAAMVLAVAASAIPGPALIDKSLSTRWSGDCSREYMADVVNEVIQSMLAHDPHTLPLAGVYKATENSHPAALDMMTAWRTVTKAGTPNLLAVDTTVGSAYFALVISEGNDAKQSVLWGRIKVANKKITELELFINRSRGDHGFSFSAEELPENYKRWMSPPADRQNPTRAELEDLSAATFNRDFPFNVTIASDCQFTEVGWRVVDPGPDGNGSYAQLPCFWPDSRPVDLNARLNLVIDEEYGIVVTGAIIPGIAYPYGLESAFIPNDIAMAQQAQEVWFNVTKAEGTKALLDPTPATAEILQVLQYYNGELQGEQLMIYLSGPGAKSAWRQ